MDAVTPKEQLDHRKTGAGPLARALKALLKLADPQTLFDVGVPTMQGSIQNLVRNGFRPGAVLDVGANHGIWTRENAPLFPEARFHMVEAQRALEQSLIQTVTDVAPETTYSVCLLGPEERAEAQFHQLGAGSSVLEELTNFEMETVTLPMRRLDDIVAEQDLPGPYFLKLDVQGYELEVLRGGIETLRTSEVALLEVSLLEYNKGAPLVAEIIAFLAAEGFVPYDICSQRRRYADDALFQSDFIFVREDSPLRARKQFLRKEPLAKA